MSAMHRGFSPDTAAAGRRRMLVLLRRFARSLPSGMSDEEKASMTAEMARRLERELEGAEGAEGAKGRTHRD